MKLYFSGEKRDLVKDTRELLEVVEKERRRVREREEQRTCDEGGRSCPVLENNSVELVEQFTWLHQD